jgi:hypothetical protein
MEQNIGKMAGMIWQTLEQKGDCTPKVLQTQLKAKSDQVFMALGWLAREGKVTFNQTKSSFKVSINTENH